MTDPLARSPALARGAGWMYVAFALFFLVSGVYALPGVGASPDLLVAVWELTFAAANGLFFWVHRGAPTWVRPLSYLVFAIGLGMALVDLFG